jgi:hypothetical protein
MAGLTRTSSATPSQQQAMEVELLESIYGEPAFRATTTSGGSKEGELIVLRIRLPLEVTEGGWWVELAATLPADYPAALPQLELVTGPMMMEPQQQHGEELLRLAERTARDNLGQAMFFTIAQELADWLEAHPPSTPPSGSPSESDAPAESASQPLRGGTGPKKRGRCRQKKNSRAKKAAKGRSGCSRSGDAIEVLHRKEGEWLPATLIQRSSVGGRGVCSVELYNGQQYEQVPSRAIRCVCGSSSALVWRRPVRAGAGAPTLGCVCARRPRRLHSRYLSSGALTATPLKPWVKQGG